MGWGRSGSLVKCQDDAISLLAIRVCFHRSARNSRLCLLLLLCRLHTLTKTTSSRQEPTGADCWLYFPYDFQLGNLPSSPENARLCQCVLRLSCILSGFMAAPHLPLPLCSRPLSGAWGLLTSLSLGHLCGSRAGRPLHHLREDRRGGAEPVRKSCATRMETVPAAG